jgi:hypothetical protein
MPRFDGTGPQGRGPMTGRGQGTCIIPVNRAPQAPAVSGIGRGLGRAAGRGLGRGAGRGLGRSLIRIV